MSLHPGLRLLAQIRAAGVVVMDVRVATLGDSTSVTVIPTSLQVAAQPTIDGFDWSQAAQDVWENLQSRGGAVAALTDSSAPNKALRSLLLMLLDDRNMLAAKVNAILTAVDGAASFAALKTAIAAIADAPTYTKAQVIAAMTTKITDGSADA